MVNYVLMTIQEPQQMFKISPTQEFSSKLLVIKLFSSGFSCHIKIHYIFSSLSLSFL